MRRRFYLRFLAFSGFALLVLPELVLQIDDPVFKVPEFIVDTGSVCEEQNKDY